MKLLLGFVIAMCLSMALIPFLLRAGNRVGGLAMGIATLMPALFWLPPDDVIAGYLVGVVTLLVLGAIDDRYPLGPVTKAFGQLVAVVVFMQLSGAHFDSVVLVKRVALPYWVGLALTLAFLMTVTNTFRLKDGLDGLAGVLTLLSCGVIALLSAGWGLPFPLTVAVLLGGSVIGFLLLSLRPKRAFMGRAGRQYLGFSLGVLTVYLVQGNRTTLSSALPLFLVGVPLIDTLSVMMSRAGTRRSLHRRLLTLGFDRYDAMVIRLAFHILLLWLAWQWRFISDVLLLGVFAVLVELVVLGLGRLERRGWRWRESV